MSNLLSIGIINGRHVMLARLGSPPVALKKRFERCRLTNEKVCVQPCFAIYVSLTSTLPAYPGQCSQFPSLRCGCSMHAFSLVCFQAVNEAVMTLLATINECTSVRMQCCLVRICLFPGYCRPPLSSCLAFGGLHRVRPVCLPPPCTPTWNTWSTVIISVRR